MPCPPCNGGQGGYEGWFARPFSQSVIAPLTRVSGGRGLAVRTNSRRGQLFPLGRQIPKSRCATHAERSLVVQRGPGPTTKPTGPSMGRPAVSRSRLPSGTSNSRRPRSQTETPLAQGPPPGPARQAGPTQAESLRCASGMVVSSTARPMADSQRGGVAATGLPAKWKVEAGATQHGSLAAEVYR